MNTPIANNVAARKFYLELTERFPDLLEIAHEYSVRTLTDLVHLQHAIGQGMTYEAEATDSMLLQLVRVLPSSSKWMQHLSDGNAPVAGYDGLRDNRPEVLPVEARECLEDMVTHGAFEGALRDMAKGSRSQRVMTNHVARLIGDMAQSAVQALHATEPRQAEDLARPACMTLVLHYGEVRRALLFKREAASPAEVDVDDSGYWRHEVGALDRMYGQACRYLGVGPAAEPAAESGAHDPAP